MSAICKSIFRSNNSIWLLHGITEQVIKAAVIAKPGPSINNALLEELGIISSFIINFNPSAKGCNKPKGPALFGPGLSCKIAATLRSPKVVYKAMPKLAKIIIAIRINFSTNKIQSNANSVIV